MAIISVFGTEDPGSTPGGTTPLVRPMMIHFTDYGTFFELTSQCERDSFVEFFFDKVQDVIQQNHVYKYEGPKQIERILNHICDNVLRIDITFQYKHHNEQWYMFAENVEIHYLDQVFKEFKHIYRHEASDFFG